MKIYDCFTFYNEFDLLEIRLEELYDVVDYFVIVEGNRTFQNSSKPYLFLENISRYEKYHDKIIHITVDDMPESSDAWARETHQRNQIVRGLTNAQPDDIIIISDSDELLRAETVKQLKNYDQMVFPFRMPLFNFKFNYMRVQPGQYDVWAMAARKSVIDHITPDELRNSRFSFNNLPLNYQSKETKILEHSGWHFGYLGNKDFLIDKAKSFSHVEKNTEQFFAQLDIEASIKERKEWDRRETAQYEIVQLNEYFPSFVYKNQDKYQQFILESHIPATNFLP
jgi:hypothetical protein